jgi:hypothetical protein
LCCRSARPRPASPSAIPPDLADLSLADPDDAAELADRLRHWRTNSEAFAARVLRLLDVLRASSWNDMARDIRDAILGAG